MLKKDMHMWIWSVSCLATGIVIGGAANQVLFGQPARASNGIPEVVSARTFQVVDEKGNVRATLSAKPDGSAGLGITTPEGRPGLAVAVGADSRPVIGFPDRQGKLRVAISITDKSDLAFNVLDKDMNPAAACVVSATGGPAVNVMDKNGSMRVRLGITDSGSGDPTASNPNLVLFDKNEKGIYQAY